LASYLLYIKGGLENMRGRKGYKLRRLLLIFLPMFLLPLSNIPLANAQFSEARIQEFDTPVEAPDFSLKDIDGNQVSLKELRGKVVILNFFTTW
jgi:cytochrome oxidase Cu insertion factor (SCO1/SenC/PrrC family)